MSTLVILLAVQTIFSILLIVWVRLKVNRSLDEGESISKVRREIGALIVELDGSADRNITILEDRLHELKECIAQADKRIVMLSNEGARASNPSAPQVRRTLDPSMNTNAQSADEIQGPERVPAEYMQSSKTRPQGNSPSLTSVSMRTDAVLGGFPVQSPAENAVPFIRFSEKPLVFEEPFTERVARLHRRSFSSDIIAAKLKVTIAEVDLAIAAGGTALNGLGDI